jgi:ribosomal RNA-processing protein 17
VQSVTSILKEAERAGHLDEDSTSDGNDAGEWGGFDDAPSLEPIDHEEEYIDEDRYTTVTVESVNISKEGLIKPEEEDSDDGDALKDETKQAVPGEGKEEKKTPKKKKPKFRYETKTERQISQRKQKAKKRR